MITAPTSKTTAKQDWRTPPRLFRELERRYGPFDVDVSADATNALCARYYDRETDGLAQPWIGANFCKPEYRDILPWVEHGIESRATVGFARAVYLLPARTGSVWFFAAYHAHCRVAFIRGRVGFCDADGIEAKGNFEDSLVLIIDAARPAKAMTVESPIVMRDLV